MGLFLLIGILLGLTAIYSVINERFLHLQSAIGLMLLALLTSLALAVVAFSILVQGSTIGKLFSPAYLKSILKS